MTAETATTSRAPPTNRDRSRQPRDGRAVDRGHASGGPPSADEQRRHEDQPERDRIGDRRRDVDQRPGRGQRDGQRPPAAGREQVGDRAAAGASRSGPTGSARRAGWRSPRRGTTPRPSPIGSRPATTATTATVETHLDRARRSTPARPSWYATAPGVKLCAVMIGSVTVRRRSGSPSSADPGNRQRNGGDDERSDHGADHDGSIARASAAPTRDSPGWSLIAAPSGPTHARAERARRASAIRSRTSGRGWARPGRASRHRRTAMPIRRAG